MLRGSLTGLVGFLALLGAVALGIRILRSAGRFMLFAAELTAAAGLAEVSARRGDITGMNESKLAAARARSSQRREAAAMLLWAAWLAVPLALGWLPEAYALASPVWLLPSPSRRARQLRS